MQSTNPKDGNGLSECFKTVSTSLYVSLAPVHLQNPINGIKQQHLDPLIMTYFTKAKGIVVAYSNIKFLENNYDNEDSAYSLAKIEGSSPFTFCGFQWTFYAGVQKLVTFWKVTYICKPHPILVF